MKSVLNIVAAVLIAAGLVVAVASLLTPGQVILGIDFKLAATLVIGGLILHALASALTHLERMSNDLRRLRQAAGEVPPWLRSPAADQTAAPAAPSAPPATVEAAAAMAMAEAAAPVSARATPDQASTAPAEEVGQHIGEQPTAASEARLAEVSGTETAAPDESKAHEEERELPFDEPQEPEAEPEARRPEPSEEPVSEVSEPHEAAVEDRDADTSGEPAPAEAAVEAQGDVPDEQAGEPEAPEEPAAEDQPELPGEPEPPKTPEDRSASEPEPVEAPVESKADGPSGITGEPELPEAEAEAAARDPAEAPSPLKPSRDKPLPGAAEGAEEPPAPAPAAQEETALYVVEERMFRGKPARVLSDGTIEAETAEGWMRFEDFDHLQEYLDAMAEMGR